MRDRTESAVGAVLLVGVVATYFALARWLSWGLVDDAGISLAFGRTLFEGEGLRLTAASQVVEGFSSPAWMLFQGFGTVLPLDSIAWSRWGGLVFAGAGLVATAFWAPVAMDRRLRVEDGLTPAVAGLNPSFAAWTSSGMEVGLWVLSLAVTGLVVLRAMRTGAALRAGVLLGALVLVRPEGPLFAAAVAPAWVLAARGRGAVLGELGRGLLGVVGVLGAVLAVRWAVFGDLLPNTWWAKRAWELDGAASLRTFLRTNAVAVWAAVAGLFVAMLWRRFGAPHAVLAVTWGLSVVGFALNGDWMGEWRLAVPMLPLLGVATMAGVDAARLLASATDGPTRRLALVVGLALAMMTGVAITDGLGRRAQVRARPALQLESVRAEARTVRRELQRLGVRRPLVVFPDVGGAAWELREAELLDPVGPCDRTVARLGRNPAALDDYLASEGPPTVVTLHGSTVGLAALPRLMGQMEHLDGALWIVRGLTADEDPRCPGGRAEAAAGAPAVVAALAADIERDEAQTALRRWRCVREYAPDELLPQATALEELAARAAQRSRDLEIGGRLEPALRQASLAVMLRRGDPALRRWADELRLRLFGPARGP